jgi:hypothetical protein
VIFLLALLDGKQQNLAAFVLDETKLAIIASGRDVVAIIGF